VPVGGGRADGAGGLHGRERAGAPRDGSGVGLRAEPTSKAPPQTIEAWGRAGFSSGGTGSLRCIDVPERGQAVRAVALTWAGQPKPPAPHSGEPRPAKLDSRVKMLATQGFWRPTAWAGAPRRATRAAFAKRDRKTERRHGPPGVVPYAPTLEGSRVVGEESPALPQDSLRTKGLETQVKSSPEIRKRRTVSRRGAEAAEKPIRSTSSAISARRREIGSGSGRVSMV